ncbi:MAG: hypothetical protein GX561_07980, partial [Lentisphaerae bacterium]|nr:hypothetical protein [Lentisphaerota bacterium]
MRQMGRMGLVSGTWDKSGGSGGFVLLRNTAVLGMGTRGGAWGTRGGAWGTRGGAWGTRGGAWGTRGGAWGTRGGAWGT